MNQSKADSGIPRITEVNKICQSSARIGSVFLKKATQMPYAVVSGQNHERSTHWVVSEDAALKIILSERWRLPLNDIVAAQAAIIEHLADGNRRVAIETPRLAELIVDYLSR